MIVAYQVGPYAVRARAGADGVQRAYLVSCRGRYMVLGKDLAMRFEADTQGVSDAVQIGRWMDRLARPDCQADLEKVLQDA